MADAAPRRFEMVEGGHSKFWQIGVKGSTITVAFGRIGADGTVKAKTFATPREADAAAAKLVNEKTKKGYVERKRKPAKATVKRPVAQVSDKGDPLAKLSALWTTKRPALEKGLRKGATSAQIVEFQRTLGLPLPKAFYAMYAWHDGAKGENEWFEGAYGFFRLALILSHKKMVDDVRGADATWDRGWVPFLQNNYTDLVCIDTVTGEVFEWFNSAPPGARVLLAPTFDAWLAQHIAITEAASSLADDDAVYDAFTGTRAEKLRAAISPGYPKGRPC